MLIPHYYAQNYAGIMWTTLATNTSPPFGTCSRWKSLAIFPRLGLQRMPYMLECLDESVQLAPLLRRLPPDVVPFLTRNILSCEISLEEGSSFA